MATAPISPLQVTIYPKDSGAQDTAVSAVATTSTQQSFWSGEGPSFKDVLDTINPLQHIPIISTIYQSLTGDVQSTGAKLTGGALFGGPIGFVASLFDSIVQSATGADITGNIMAAIEGKPVPAMHNGGAETADNSSTSFLSANQRAAYNAYVRTSALA